MSSISTVLYTQLDDIKKQAIQLGEVYNGSITAQMLADLLTKLFKLTFKAQDAIATAIVSIDRKLDMYEKLGRLG